MKISALFGALCLIASASVAFSEPMFDQTRIREIATLSTCSEWLDWANATEMTGDSGQDLALQGAVIGYINGMIDGMLFVAAPTDGPEAAIGRIYGNCLARPDELVARVIYESVTQ